jgi:hypothetical protein
VSCVAILSVSNVLKGQGAETLCDKEQLHCMFLVDKNFIPVCLLHSIPYACLNCCVFIHEPCCLNV